MEETTPIQLSEETVQLILQRSRDHVTDFLIATNPIYTPNWHLDEISTELERIEKEGDKNYKILLVFMPPRHGKSELCTVGFPAWYLGRNPTKEVITVSYSGELAQDFGGKTRTLVGSDAYQAIFDIKLKEDEQGKAKWKTEKGGSYTSVGVGGSVTGRGANILIFDDPIKNRQEAESETYRQAVWDFFTSTAFTRLEPNGVVVVILTRWHVDDLAGRILANAQLAQRCKIIHFPAIAIRDEDHRKQGEALWPERFPISALEEIKSTIGPYDFEALYQGSPVLTESQEFKPEWYKYVTQEEVNNKLTKKILTIDPAISKASQADWTGFADNSIDQEKFWNIRAWHQRLNPDELVNAIFALHEQRRYDQIGIEETTFTQGLKPYLDAEQRRRGIFLPITPLKHRQIAKEIRIRGLIPLYASGSIRHIKGQCSALEQEFAQFPNGLNDDIIDALAYQLQIMEKGSGEIHIHRSANSGFARRRF